VVAIVHCKNLKYIFYYLIGAVVGVHLVITTVLELAVVDNIIAATTTHLLVYA